MTFFEARAKEQEFEQKLWNGDLSLVNTNDLSNWIDDLEWSKIRCLAHGAIMSGRFDIVSFIYETLQNLILRPGLISKTPEELRYLIRHSGTYPASIDSLDKGELINYRSKQLERGSKRVISSLIAWLSNISNHQAQEIFAKASNSPIRDFRLYCAGATEEPETFLTDEDIRIRKVADIRVSFANKLSAYLPSERELIAFLAMALRNQNITCSDGLISYKEEDLMSAIFYSSMFDNPSYVEFDRDIFETILDEHILASAIYDLIKEGKYRFVPGQEPSIYNQILAEKNERK